MTASDAGVVLTSDSGVATITLSREAKRNALAHRHFVSLAALLRQADADDDVKVVVLTGAGDRAFCAGADLSPDEAFFERIDEVATTGLGDAMRQARRMSKPLVGRINGHCYAGGVGLLSVCDVAIAVDDARIALPEIGLGLFPFVVMAGLKRKIAPGFIDELALTGKPVTAARAEQMGLLMKSVPRPEFDTAMADLIGSLARVPSQAFRAGRAAQDYASFETELTAAEAATRELAARRRNQNLPVV